MGVSHRLTEIFYSHYSERNGVKELFYMNIDGSNVQQLTHDNAQVWVLSWEYNGDRIAFKSQWSNDR